MKKSFSIRILLAAAILVLTSCSLETGPKLGKSPIGEMAITAPEGYGNKTAAARNQDGIDHLLREHWRKAEADFDRALESDPNLAAAHFNLALSLDQQEKRAEAVTHFKKAVELAPNDPRIRENEILKKYIR
ncbi:MAG: tetratricopeptide repeat protein [Nitrospirae bacterium]|nr:tetratricopeptide repeat protein [Nitrospirota bacterium]